jgi:hypothetical protein
MKEKKPPLIGIVFDDVFQAKQLNSFRVDNYGGLRLKIIIVLGL